MLLELVLFKQFWCFFVFQWHLTVALGSGQDGGPGGEAQYLSAASDDEDLHPLALSTASDEEDLYPLALLTNTSDLSHDSKYVSLCQYESVNCA